MAGNDERFAAAVLAAVLCLLGGCGSDGNKGHGGEDAGPDAADVSDSAGPSLDSVLEMVGPEDAAGTEEVSPAPLVSARIVESLDELLPGAHALGRVGDFILENEHLTVIIGKDHARWGPYGGGILDLAPKGQEDQFIELFPLAGFLRAVKPETIEIASDGTDGEAVVRVTGTDGAVPLLDAAFNTIPLGIEVTVEYSLSQGARYLDVTTTVTNTGEADLSIPLGDFLSFADRGRVFGSVAGFDIEDILKQTAMEYLGSDGPEVSYLLVPEAAASMSLAFLENETNPVMYGFDVVEAGGSHSLSRRLYVGPGRCSAVLASYWEDSGTPLFPVNGSLAIETECYDFAAAWVLFMRDGLFSGAAGPDPDGTFEAALPAGNFSGTAQGVGFEPVSEEFEAQVGGGPAEVTLDPKDPGRIEVQVAGEGGASFPGRVSLQAGLDAEQSVPLLDVTASKDGAAQFFVLPGDYTVVGSHGPQWSLCKMSVSVAEGESASVSCEVKQEVVADGWMSGDLHTHSEYGIDSMLDRYLRVAILAAEGLDIFVSTDHDIFTDFTPVVEELGLTGTIIPVVGNEISQLTAHFNAMDCKADGWEYLEFEWMEFDENGEVVEPKPAPEVWQSLHDDFDAQFVQINHPREGTGYLDAVGYDPEVGPSSAKPGQFDTNFDGIEVWNADNDWPHMSTKTLPDWYSLLNRGISRTATGNSDSHALKQWVGQPRNVVKVDSPTKDDYFPALRAFRSQVTSAPFVDFTIDGKTLGETVVPVSPEQGVTVEIQVQAASWVPLDTILLVANGETIRKWPVPASTDVARFQVSEAVVLPADAWLHVIAQADATREPLYPGRTCLAFTNPIWVDLDGDGFDPPIVE